MIKKEQVLEILETNTEWLSDNDVILKSDFSKVANEIVKLCNLHIVSKRLILENLRERMQGVYPEYYLSIIDDEIEGLNGC